MKTGVLTCCCTSISLLAGRAPDTCLAHAAGACFMTFRLSACALEHLHLCVGTGMRRPQQASPPKPSTTLGNGEGGTFSLRCGQLSISAQVSWACKGLSSWVGSLLSCCSFKFAVMQRVGSGPNAHPLIESFLLIEYTLIGSDCVPCMTLQVSASSGTVG